jgi:hypothetical protein
MLTGGVSQNSLYYTIESPPCIESSWCMLGPPVQVLYVVIVYRTSAYLSIVLA